MYIQVMTSFKFYYFTFCMYGKQFSGDATEYNFLLPEKLDEIGVRTTHTLPLLINTHLSRNSICDLIPFCTTLSTSK